MKRMNDIETNDVEVTPNGTVISGTMTYEANKLGSVYIVLVNSNIKWDESGNGWRFTIKGRPARGAWISSDALSRLINGTAGGNPHSGVAILY